VTRSWRLLPLLLLCGCSGLDRLLDEPAPTLAELPVAQLPPPATPPPRLARAEVAALYRQALAQQQDAPTRLRTAHRLADLQMMAAEERLASGVQQDPGFQAAIDAYRALLRDNPGYAGRDRILYQLSRAYALDGQLALSQATLRRLGAEAPDSPYLAEAAFRLAEREFAESHYAAAERLYTQVIAQGVDTPFHTRALYMQGWSRFKQDHYAEAIDAFCASLDESLGAGQPVAALPRAEQELVRDSLRVLAIVFSKLQGTRSIASAGSPHYEYLLYEALGELYLAQERYQDSAATYRAFLAGNPASPHAHRFALRVIQAYQAGGFEDMIVSAKAGYVERFQPGSDYWRRSEAQARQTIAGHLRDYVPQLASHHHALAQAQRDAAPRQAAQHYARAAAYYRLYLDSFPDDPQVPQLAFLLGESLYESGDYPAAIDAYDWLAYSLPDAPRAADAAYTAILAHAQLEAAQDPAPAALQRRRIAAELRFQANFPGDERANEVLAHAANQLLQLADYPAAVAAASTLVGLSPAPRAELRIPAWLVMGHSYFALEDYLQAEIAYREGLALLAAADTRREAATQRLAAAIYRQGEADAAAGRHDSAAAHFRRAMVAAPASRVRMSAQYDAATALMQAGELQQANTLLQDFRRRYPQHELTAGIGATLVQNYEALQDWQSAAGELDTLRAGQDDPDAARRYLLGAARYYDAAGDTDRAIARYRSYAHDWPQPLDDNLEAVHRLTELYAASGASDKRRYWLERTMAIHDEAGAAQSGRSAYLAAQAASLLGDERFDAFRRERLTLPLARTLPRKQATMQRALDAYKRCSGYGVDQFITLCTFRLGEVYRQLATDLLQSQRPQDLDALALEQYDLLLEEQAYPFEEMAIELHESNALRARQGLYDEWVARSFAVLGELLPARYARHENTEHYALAGSAGRQHDTASGQVWELNRQAIALRHAGEFPAAEQAYLAALTADADHPATHRNLGILYDLYLGVPGRALHHYVRFQTLTGGSERNVGGWIADLERRHASIAREIH